MLKQKTFLNIKGKSRSSRGRVEAHIVFSNFQEYFLICQLLELPGSSLFSHADKSRRERLEFLEIEPICVGPALNKTAVRPP